ncbi:hypothetical protein PoB_004632500 [Plakobranchus ocellatus]|uniref:Uncharacterized protein n=1 Tax=Plakobranchus ocellatus TaxID=259542 RepID=A0AAV4BK17_9GAST|nr:hypothetical protein PoB_004632500 [Plakobranchus ocellatus]
MKAGETFELEHRTYVKSSLVQGQFSIQKDRSRECRAKVFLPRSTSTPHPTPAQNPYLQGNGDIGIGVWQPDIESGNQRDNDQLGGNGDKGPSHNGYETVNIEAGGSGDQGAGSSREGPRFDNSRGEKEGDTSGGGGGGKDGAVGLQSGPSAMTLLLVAVSVVLSTSGVISKTMLRTSKLGHMMNIT